MECFFVAIKDYTQSLVFNQFGQYLCSCGSPGHEQAGGCHNTLGDTDSRSYEINRPYYRGGSPEECLVWKDNISAGPQMYTFTERFLTVDAKATYNQAALDIDIRTIDNFNKSLM